MIGFSITIYGLIFWSAIFLCIICVLLAILYDACVLPDFLDDFVSHCVPLIAGIAVIAFFVALYMGLFSWDANDTTYYASDYSLEGILEELETEDCKISYCYTEREERILIHYSLITGKTTCTYFNRQYDSTREKESRDRFEKFLREKNE